MGSVDTLRRATRVPVLLAIVTPLSAFAGSPPVLSAPRSADPVNRPSGSPGADVPSIRVRYHDLDLTTPEGVAALYLRIHRASRDQCGASSPPTGTRLISAASSVCVRVSISAAIRQIGVPGLAALDAVQQALDAATSSVDLCDRTPRAKIII
jgi:UrcA family protein